MQSRIRWVTPHQLETQVPGGASWWSGVGKPTVHRFVQMNVLSYSIFVGEVPGKVPAFTMCVTDIATNLKVWSGI